MINSAKIMFFSVIVICIALLKGEKYIEKYFLKQLYIVDAEDPQTKDAKIDLFNMF